MKIGIIGNGFVGNATMQLKCKDIEVMAYDLNPDLRPRRGRPSKKTTSDATA